MRDAGDGAAAGLPAAVEVSRAQPQNLPRPLLDAVLRADTSKLPAVVGVEVPGEGYAVARITQVLPPDAKSPEMAQLMPRYAAAWGQAEGEALYAALKARYKVELKGAGVAPAASAPTN